MSPNVVLYLIAYLHIYSASTFIVSRIEQVPLKTALGSTTSTFVFTSPFILAVLRKVSASFTTISPNTVPTISAFEQEIEPLSIPLGPIITLPLQIISPSTSPSILKSLSATILPTILLPLVSALYITPELVTISLAIIKIEFVLVSKITALF